MCVFLFLHVCVWIWPAHEGYTMLFNENAINKFISHNICEYNILHLLINSYVHAFKPVCVCTYCIDGGEHDRSSIHRFIHVLDHAYTVLYILRTCLNEHTRLSVLLDIIGYRSSREYIMYWELCHWSPLEKRSLIFQPFLNFTNAGTLMCLHPSNCSTKAHTHIHSNTHTQLRPNMSIRAMHVSLSLWKYDELIFE